MPEYLAPGVYVEETSFRNKSIEGVSTTTTGFVGPCRYGPIDLDLDVLTSLLDFERAYGDRRLLDWKGDRNHNYLWHGVRAFFEEGGKRLYVARVFRPLKDENGEELTAKYTPPPDKLTEDDAKRAGKFYELDGHARLWLTKESAALSTVAQDIAAALAALDETQEQAALAKDRGQTATRVTSEAAEAAQATQRSAKAAVDKWKDVSKALTKAKEDAGIASGSLPPNTLSGTLFDALNAASDAGQKALNEAALRAVGATTSVTFAVADTTAGAAAGALAAVAADTPEVVAKATAAKTAANNAANASQGVKDAVTEMETKVKTAATAVTAAKNAADDAKTKTAAAKASAENTPDNARADAEAAEAAAAIAAENADIVLSKTTEAVASANAAQVKINAASNLPAAVRTAHADAQTAIAQLAAKVQQVVTGAQAVRSRVSSALSRVRAMQNLLAALDAAVTAAKGVSTEYTNNAVVKMQKLADETNDNANNATQPLKETVAAAKQAVDNAAAAAVAAQQAVANVKQSLTDAQKAIETEADDQSDKLQALAAKSQAATKALDDLAIRADAASSKAATAASAAAAVGTAQKITDAAGPAKDTAAAAATKVGPAITAFQPVRSDADSLASALAKAGIREARDATEGAATALASFEEELSKVAKEVTKAELTLADTLARFAGATVDGGVPQQAVLLRARFPGQAGNLKLGFGLRFSQSILRGSVGKAQASGLQNGDLVWIGSPPRSDDARTSGELFVATKDPDLDEWRFGPDADKGNLKFWLNSQTDPALELDPQKHFLRISTLEVTAIPDDGASQTWTGLALQPGHVRAGAPDTLMDKFGARPSSLLDARTLPFVALIDPDSLKTAGAIYQTIFGRMDAKLTLTRDANLVYQEYLLAGGNDGQRPGAAEYEGEEKARGKTGLKAMEDIEDISIIAAPGASYRLNNGYRRDAEAILQSLISHAQRMRYRIAVLDSGDGQAIAEVRATKAKLDSSHAALYYPWVKVLDPVTRQEINLPPSGFVTGIYARNDIQRAVWKAPANEVVNGAIGFEQKLNKAQQEVLNPEGVNCFRFFEGRGFRLWGARTTSSDPEWKYVNIRRYFAYLERSIDKGTQWAVFEPNGEALWANVRRTIEDFLLNEWQSGALLGEKPEKAFFVKCDRSTMSQNDLDNGRLICLIGVAPLKPAEFVIFRIGQWTADRKV